MMAGFISQLAWAAGYPDTWLNIVLGVSLNVILGGTNICGSELSEAYCLSRVVVSPSPVKACLDRKAEQEGIGSLSLCLFVFKPGHALSPHVAAPFAAYSIQACRGPDTWVCSWLEKVREE